MIVEMGLLAIGVILFLGFFGERIFEKTRIPDVLWLIIVGIVIGSVLQLTSSTAFAQIAPFFTTFALLFLLFEAGINTDIRSFIQTAPRGLALSVLGFALSCMMVIAIGLALGYSLVLSLLMGTILAGVSSAVVIPIIKEMELHKVTKLSLLFDSAFSDVLCILGTVTLIEIITLGGAVDGLAITKEVFASFLIAIAIGLIAALVWNNVLSPRIKSHTLGLTLGFMLMVYAVTQLIDANGAIACLVFGLILGNTKKLSRIFSDKEPEKKKGKTPSVSMLQTITKSSRDVYGELAFVIKTFFFVYLGLLIDFSNPMSFVYALVIVFGLFFIRPFVVAMVFPKTTKLQDANMLSSLIPKGLAAAVLVQLPIQAGIPGAESLVNITLAVVLISIVVAALLSVVIQKNPNFKGVIPFLFRKFQR